MNTEFTNENLSLKNLPKHQEAHYQKIAKEKLKVMFLSSATFYAILITTYITINIFIEEENNYHLHFFIAFFIVITLHGFYLFHSFHNQFYALRSKDILYKYGVFTKSTTIIPFNRIQHISIDQGIYSRWFGIANIELFTAGGNDLEISGLYMDDAQKIKEFISNTINNEEMKSELIIEETENKIDSDEQ